MNSFLLYLVNIILVGKCKVSTAKCFKSDVCPKLSAYQMGCSKL